MVSWLSRIVIGAAVLVGTAGCATVISGAPSSTSPVLVPAPAAAVQTTAVPSSSLAPPLSLSQGGTTGPSTPTTTGVNAAQVCAVIQPSSVASAFGVTNVSVMPMGVSSSGGGVTTVRCQITGSDDLRVLAQQLRYPAGVTPDDLIRLGPTGFGVTGVNVQPLTGIDTVTEAITFQSTTAGVTSDSVLAARPLGAGSMAILVSTQDGPGVFAQLVTFTRALLT